MVAFGASLPVGTGYRAGLEATVASGSFHSTENDVDTDLGTLRTGTTSDPGRLLLTGQPADLGMMDDTNLRGISRTAPYFHNNSAATLEDVVDHDIAFFTRAARLNPPPNLPPILSSTGLVVDRGFVAADERAALLAYLRKL